MRRSASILRNLLSSVLIVSSVMVSPETSTIILTVAEKIALNFQQHNVNYENMFGKARLL